MRHNAAWACALSSAMLLSGCEIGTEAPPGGTRRVVDAVEAPGQHEPGAQTGGFESHAARGELRFVEGYQRGREQALAERKPMLVFFTAEWCHFCHQMADDAFTHPQVVRLSEQFVCILVDADREPRTCRRFQVTGYPTIQFLSPRGVPLERVVGKKPGHQLMMAMQAALQNVARRDGAGEKTNLQ